MPQVSSWLEYVFLGHIEAGKVQAGSASKQPFLGLDLDIDLLSQDPQTAWKQSMVPPGTLIVITFDEADYDAEGYDTNYDGPNQVYAVLLGDMIEPGTVIDTPFNHYSLIKTVERAFGTSNLGKNDQDANWLRFLWGESFHWSAPATTGLRAGGQLALAAQTDGTHLIYNEGDGSLLSSVFDGTCWSEADLIGLDGAEGALALSSYREQLLLTFVRGDGQLYWALRGTDGQWTTEAQIGQDVAGDVVISS